MDPKVRQLLGNVKLVTIRMGGRPLGSCLIRQRHFNQLIMRISAVV